MLSPVELDTLQAFAGLVRFVQDLPRIRDVGDPPRVMLGAHDCHGPEDDIGAGREPQHVTCCVGRRVGAGLSLAAEPVPGGSGKGLVFLIPSTGEPEE